MEKALRALLLADAGVVGLVGGGQKDGGVEWSRRKQGSRLPAAVLHLISAPRGFTQKARQRLNGDLVQIDCWAATADGARILRDAVVAALDSGNAAPTPPLRRLFVETIRSDIDTGEAGQSDVYRQIVEVRVWSLEA